MSALLDAVNAAFSPSGVLAQYHPQFQARSGQLQMAVSVTTAIDQGHTVVIEAGTGIGKTFAYLVPALLSGKRVMISTATKALQDQLYTRDLPQLIAAMALPIKRAVLKGRQNYLCLHRLAQARSHLDAEPVSTGQAHTNPLRQLALVEQWSHHTTTGDMNELPGLPERSVVWGLVTSTTANCLYALCPSIGKCHLYKARQMAEQANVVVINHHLLFADSALRAQGDGQLLAHAEVVVVDEAHQINDIGVQFLGIQLSVAELLAFSQELAQCIENAGNGAEPGRHLQSHITDAVRQWQSCCPEQNDQAERWYWGDNVPNGVNPDLWTGGLKRLLHTLQHAVAGVQQRSDLYAQAAADAEGYGTHGALLLRKAHQYIACIEQFLAPMPPNTVRWLELQPALRMVQAPLHIADAIGSLQQSDGDASAREAQSDDERAVMHLPEKNGAHPNPHPHPNSVAWIFTSATLGHDAQLSWFTTRCGLGHLPPGQIVRIASPFDYLQQAAFYVPTDWPPPQDTLAHGQAVANWVARAACAIGGRTLVLTTTHKAIHTIAGQLEKSLLALGDKEGVLFPLIDIMVQGADPKLRMMERFRAANARGQAGCILVATSSFWEGFDVPGQALQLVVIDKLPFAPPDDPWIQAHTHRIESTGGKVFKDYILPDVIMKMRQGAGRLIRHEKDQGLLVIADSRLRSKGYGKKILNALPAMRHLESDDAALSYLSQLNR